MNIKKPVLAGLMCLATIAPCKAQKPVQFASSTAINRSISNKISVFSGLDILIPKKNNMTDIFSGVMLQQDKTTSLVFKVVDNYSWTKHISSYVREALMISGKGTNSTLEVAPIKANANVNKFNFSLGPAYTLYNDFKNGTTTQGINMIFQTTYSMTPKDKLIAEAKYVSTPSKNLFDTHFGKLKDNTSVMIAYMRIF